ncbi:MAG: FtsX-like permease family protein, partial [Bacteroidetes bacterium]|nr:FtsX-like permease family protein [Bacteroidota bacterium]
ETWSDNAHQVIISQSMADKYFSQKNPIGNYLEFEGLGEIQVKGVFRESKGNSHLSFNMILPYVWAEKMAGEGANSWDMLVISTYLLTKEGVHVSELENKITGLAASYSTSEDQVNYSLDPVSEIYLSANLDGDLGRQSDITYIYIFSSISLLILLIAVLNFISLSSARAIERAGEVGVRKVFGANRSQLMQQFLGEAAVLVFMALLISLGMVELAMPYFNQLIDRELVFPLFENLWLIPGLIVGGGMLAFIAGAYPALILSGFSPRQIFSSGVKQSKSLGSRFRGGLVIIQFSITFILISSTIIINQQLNFLHRKDLGFNQDFVLVVPLKGENLKRDYELFKNELAEFSGISSATASYHTPGRGLGMYFFEIEGEKEPIPLVSYSVDEDFLSTLEIEVMEGRGFSKNMTTDSSSAFLVNEAMVKQFGWGTEALGKQIIADGGKKGNVIGV